MTAGARIALGEVTLELEVESDELLVPWPLRGLDRHHRGLSMRAYLNAVNAIAAHNDRGHVREVVGRPARGGVKQGLSGSEE